MATPTQPRMTRSASTNSPAAGEEMTPSAAESPGPGNDEQWHDYFEQISSPQASHANSAASDHASKSMRASTPGNVMTPGDMTSTPASNGGASNGTPASGGIMGRLHGRLFGSGSKKSSPSPAAHSPARGASPAVQAETPPPPPRPPPPAPRAPKDDAPGYQKPQPPPTPPLRQNPAARYGEQADNGASAAGGANSMIQQMEQEKKAAREAAAAARAGMPPGPAPSVAAVAAAAALAPPQGPPPPGVQPRALFPGSAPVASPPPPSVMPPGPPKDEPKKKKGFFSNLTKSSKKPPPVASPPPLPTNAPGTFSPPPPGMPARPAGAAARPAGAAGADSSTAFDLSIPKYEAPVDQPAVPAGAAPDDGREAAAPWKQGLQPSRWYAYEDIVALEEKYQRLQVQLMATAEERDRLRVVSSKLGGERDDAVAHIHTLEGSFRQQASAYSAKMQAELAQEREYSRSLESSFKEQAARFTQSLKAELQAELEETRAQLGARAETERSEKNTVSAQLRNVKDDADRYKQEAHDRARATQATLDRVAALERELAEKKASEKRMELQLRHAEAAKSGTSQEVAALQESLEAQRVNAKLQEEHGRKIKDSFQRAEDEWKEIEKGLLKQIEGEATYSKRLLDDNSGLRKQIGDLQGGYFKEVEELVYLRWVNACLRFELRRKKGPGGGAGGPGFSALDLSYEMNPESQKLAMALMHEYGTAEKRATQLEKLRNAGKISADQMKALAAPNAENLAGNFKGMLGPQMEKNMKGKDAGQRADALIQLLAKGVPGIDISMGDGEGAGGKAKGPASALEVAISGAAKDMEEARAVGKIAPKQPVQRGTRKASKPPVRGKVGSAGPGGGPPRPGGVPPPPPPPGMPGAPPLPPGMPGMKMGMKGAALAMRGSKWTTIKHTLAVVAFYQQIMKRDGAINVEGGGGGGGAVDVRAEIRGEIEGRSSHMLAVKKDVEVQGPFVEELAEEVRALDIENGSMEDLVAFVSWLDHELDFLVDENAVLKHFDWPHDKADALREAAAEYRVLRNLEGEVKAFELEQGMKPEQRLAVIEKFFDKADSKVTEKAKERDSLLPKYKKHKIPTTWLQDSGAVGDVKHATIRLARMFCQTIFTVSEGMQSGDSGKEEEMNREFLVMQGVKFAFRVHQFAGGFDNETLEAFEKLRLLASAPGGGSPAAK